MFNVSGCAFYPHFYWIILQCILLYSPAMNMNSRHEFSISWQFSEASTSLKIKKWIKKPVPFKRLFELFNVLKTLPDFCRHFPSKDVRGKNKTKNEYPKLETHLHSDGRLVRTPSGHLIFSSFPPFQNKSSSCHIYALIYIYSLKFNKV
jgi:hypothetical protein